MISSVEGTTNRFTPKNFFIPSSNKDEDIHLITDPSDEIKRADLLKTIKINGSNVVTCTDPKSLIETSLAVVIIEAKTCRTHPLTQPSPDQPSLLSLPTQDAYKAGFYIAATEKQLRVVARSGEYKGLPLTARLLCGQRYEVPYRLNGFNKEEEIELYWAKRIKLFSVLHFPEPQTRGILKCSLFEGSWSNSPLYIAAKNKENPEKTDIFKEGTPHEQPLINRVQLLIYQDWEEPKKNPLLGKLVGAFDIQITSKEP